MDAQRHVGWSRLDHVGETLPERKPGKLFQWEKEEEMVALKQNCRSLEVEEHRAVQKLLCSLIPIPWSLAEKAVVLLLPVCMAREEGVPRQSSLPHLAQLVNNNPGAIWHFSTPNSRLQRSRGGIAGQKVALLPGADPAEGRGAW